MRENLEIIFDKNGITAGFTNRLGGVSEGKFSSLNLFRCGIFAFISKS